MELNAETLKILLDALIALDSAYLRTMARMGRRIPHLYESGVRYGRTQTWDTIPDLYVKGYGDCKSLTAAFIAQAREAGYDCEPTFRYSFRTIEDPETLRDWKEALQEASWRFGPESDEVKQIAKRNDGGLDYHILVQTDGRMMLAGQPLPLRHDPSKVLGMTDAFPQ
jgi:hypothetical protein